MAIKLPERPAAATDSAIAQKAVAKALEHLAKQWEISGTEIAQLLRVPPNTVNDWRAKGKVPLAFGEDRLDPRAEVILHLLACQRSLESMFRNAEDQRAWLRTKHPDFNAAPIDIMKRSSESLFFVRGYLDYVRGRGA